MNDSISDQPHKRRIHYSGTHPHTFAEKYKELNPEKYKARENLGKTILTGAAIVGGGLGLGFLVGAALFGSKRR